MTVRKPLVIISGQIRELPSGDTTTGGSGSTSVTEVELDFGSYGSYGGTFQFSDPNATTASKIIMVASASPGTGKIFGEHEMDGFSCAAVCLVDGTITASITVDPGPVVGAYKFNYMMG